MSIILPDIIVVHNPSVLEPYLLISNETVYIKVYSFELKKIVYENFKTISNEPHPPCWYPESNLLVLEADYSRCVDCLGQWEEPCVKFRGKYNLCVSNHPISDEILEGKEEIHSKELYLLSGEIGEEECQEIRFMDEGICLFIRIRDPVKCRIAEEEFIELMKE